MSVPAMVLGLTLWTAAAAVGDLPQQYQDALIVLRTGNDPARRALAAIALGHGLSGLEAAPDADVVAALGSAMRADQDPTVQAMASYALCVLRDRRAVSNLIAAVQSSIARGVDQQGPVSDAVRLPIPYLYRALGHVGGPEATAFLIEIARAGPARARVPAIAALGLVVDDDGQVERALARLAGDADPNVRNAARYVLGERRPPRRK